MQLRHSSHVQEKDEALLGGVMVGGVWNGFLLGSVRGQPVPCRFCGGRGPWCLLWHGWLPFLSGSNGASPWAGNAAESAGNLLECSLGSYSSRLLLEWNMSDEFDSDDIAQRLPADPNVWTDGGLFEK